VPFAKWFFTLVVIHSNRDGYKILNIQGIYIVIKITFIVVVQNTTNSTMQVAY